MVNNRRIHKELGKFFMISLNLIKLDDEMVIKLSNLIFKRENSKMNPGNETSLNLDQISQRNYQMNKGEIFEK